MKNRSRGFTLMELMLVLTLAGIILAIASPSFSEFRRSNRMAAVSNDFLVGVQVARSEAIKRQTGVSLCPSLDPEAAEPKCDNVKGFAGWIVFADPNNNCQREVDDPDEALLEVGARVDTAGPSARTTSVSDGACIGFAATGFTRPNPGPGLASAQHTLFCDDRGNAPQPGTELSSARAIDVSPTGRARVTRDRAEITRYGTEFNVVCGGAS
jgi:type IV fimbrial biogenesis protein FimT